MNKALLLDRLEIYLSRNPLSTVVQGFLVLHPEEVLAFMVNEESLRVAGEDQGEMLEEFIRLANEFEYERMFFEAYSAILRIQGNWLPSHNFCGHRFSADDVFDWEEEGISGLVTLIAKNGVR